MRDACYDQHHLTLAPSPRALLNWIKISRAMGSIKAAFEVTILRQFTESDDSTQVQFLIDMANGSGMNTWKLPKSKKEAANEKVKKEKQLADFAKKRAKRSSTIDFAASIAKEFGRGDK